VVRKEIDKENVNGINRADMIFAMAKEYALNLKRENHQRKQRRKARVSKHYELFCSLDKIIRNSF